jgi:hypothetical protein
MFKIEKDIPIPAKKGGQLNHIALLNEMAPGDSVLLPKNQANYLYFIGKRQKRKMVTRAEGDKKRVWYVGPL